MKIDNTLYYGDACITNLNSVIELTQSKILYLGKSNDEYKEIIRLMENETKGSFSFYNTINRCNLDLNESNFNILCDINDKITSKECTSNKFSFVNPFVERIKPFSSPLIEIKINDSVRILDRYWIFTNKYINSQTIKDKIIKKACKTMSKILTDNNYSLPDNRLTIAYSIRPVDNDCYIKIQFVDILTDTNIKNKLVEEYGKALSCFKFGNMSCYLTKYNNLFNTSCYEGQLSWKLMDEVLYYDLDISNMFPYEDLITNYTRFLSANYQGDKQICGEYEEEYEEENEDLELDCIRICNLDPETSQLMIILKYIPDEYFKEKYDQMLLSFNTTEKFKTIFKFMTEKRRPEEKEFEKKWNTKKYSKIRKEFYYRITIIHNKFEEYGIINDFKTEYTNFIIHQLKIILLEYDGRLNHKFIADLMNYILIGKFYTNADKTRKSLIYWYDFKDDISNYNESNIFKWSKGVSIPSVIETHYVTHYISNYIERIIKDFEHNTEITKQTSSFLKTLKTTKLNLGNTQNLTGVVKLLSKQLMIDNLDASIDSVPHVIGVHGGCLDLDLQDKKDHVAYPKFYKGYCEYFVTKSANATFIPEIYDLLIKYDGPDNCPDSDVRRVWEMISDIIIEPDAREYIVTNTSTMLDDKLSVKRVLQIVAGGANGKSVYSDNMMYVLGNYSTKLNTNVLRDKNKAGSADPEFMKTEGKRGGFITETNPGDVLLSSRIKELTERIKTGRKLHHDEVDFVSNITITILSNYFLEILDKDYGIWRRMIVYNAKRVFKENPIHSNERKLDNKFETIAQDDEYFANALFTILVYFRLRLYNKYNDDMANIKSPTLEKETENYRIQQDKLSQFISRKIVRLYGYRNGDLELSKEKVEEYYEDEGIRFSEIVTMDELILAYKEWYKLKFNNVVKENDEVIAKDFIDNGKLKKMMTRTDEGEIFKGIRIVENKLKLETFDL